MVRRAEFHNVLLPFTNNHWFHIVFNYIGPDPDEGYRVYHDGIQVVGDVGIQSDPRAPQVDAKIVIGRRFTAMDGFYSSLVVDELLFFNRALTNDEIKVMSI